ncbi:MAG TPA: hypothetical protein VHG51_10690 [Longimicrobiaceae bacterium]|nr:hypothetical protein [Longimicrobiaceae bacterium]
MRSTRSKLATTAALLLLAGCSGDGIVSPGDEARLYTEYQCETSPCGPQLPPSGGIATHDYGSEIIMKTDTYTAGGGSEPGKWYRFQAYSWGNEWMYESEVALVIYEQPSCVGTFTYWRGSRDRVYHNGQARTVTVYRETETLPQYYRVGWRIKSTHTFTPQPRSTGGGTFELTRERCD